MTREAPKDLVAEACVLGSLLLDGERACAAVRPILGPEHFERPAHQTIYAAILEVMAAGEWRDVVTLKAAMERAGTLAAVGGLDYLVELQQVPDAANAAYYARIVRDKADARAVITLARELATAAYDPTTAPDDLKAMLRDAAMSLAVTQDGESTTAAEAARLALERSRAIQAGEIRPGVPTGFSELDLACDRGFRKGEVIVVAARTGGGKTAFAGSMACNAAQAGLSVAVFSLEMLAEELAVRYLAALGGVDGGRVAAGWMHEPEWERAREAQAIMETWGERFRIFDRPRTVGEMEARVREMGVRLGKPVDLVIVDYLQLVPCREGGALREKINNISHGVKRMAMAVEAPVVLLSQLTRSPGKENRKPELHDLKESGDIENDANKVLLLHTDDPPTVQSGRVKVDLRMAKNRSGSTPDWGRIVLWFHPEQTRFEADEPSGEGAGYGL